LLIYWTAVFNDRQLVPGCKIIDAPLMDIQHWTNLCDTGSVQIRNRLKTTDPSLKDQGHHKRLNSIIKMVAKRQFIQPPL
jgi:hypothetical protein